MSHDLPKVYLVRHGETAWAATGRHSGRKDIPLTEAGEREAEALRGLLAGSSFTTVFTSPLQRARRTCELAGHSAGVKADPDLMEWDCGAYEGRRTVEIRQDRPGWRLFEDGCPDGESPAAIGARADRVIERLRKIPGNALLFAHRDVLRVLTARWLGLPATEGRLFLLATASLSVLGYDHNREEPVIHRWNITARVPD